MPPVSALLSLLVLKWLAKERRSPSSDFHADEALGLFAGLNILPKNTSATDDSYRTQRDQQQHLLRRWIAGWIPLLSPKVQAFSLDFPPIPYRGDPTGLDQHYLPRQSQAGPRVLSFFALEQESRVLCSANANLTRPVPPGEPMRFVEFWHEATGTDPKWLSFDSKVVPYGELSRLNQRTIPFVTIRRRGAAVLRRLSALPASAWPQATLNLPKRRHPRIRVVEESIRRGGSEGRLRQVAVAGLGREQPPLLLSNNFTETCRALVIRYAGRNCGEDGLGISINFFHLDGLCSEVRLNVDLDSTLTVGAHGCDRWRARQLKGFEKAAPKRLSRKFVETGGEVEVQAERIVVRLDKQSHNPILREARLDKDRTPIEWLGNRFVTLEYP